MKLKHIVEFNPESIDKTIFKINYVDTSSSYDGRILSFQTLNLPFPSRAQRLLKENDIIISSVRPNLKHNAIVSKNQNNFVGSTGYIQLRSKTSNINPRYLFYILNSNSIVDKLVQIAETSQSSYPSINQTDLENIELEIPDKQEQDHIVDIM